MSTRRRGMVTMLLKSLRLKISLRIPLKETLEMSPHPLRSLLERIERRKATKEEKEDPEMMRASQ